MTSHTASRKSKCSQCSDASTPAKPQTLFLRPLADPRDSFRLLTLDAGSGKDPLVASLHEVRRSANPPYDCLSYTWMTDARKSTDIDLLKPITVNGEVVAIRSNLWYALRAVRNQNLGHCIWVDALCICQHDDVEKSQQVQMIGATFRCASRVLCWVTDHDTFARLIRSVCNKGVAASPSSSSSTQICWPGRDEYSWSRYNTRRLALLCGMRYFTRSWILQELILANHITIICGSVSIEEWAFEQMVNQPTEEEILLSDFAKAVGQPDSHAVNTSSRIEYVRQVFHIRRQYKQTLRLPHSIWYYLSTFHESKCQDPRDKIYSLLSLVESFKTDGTLLEADYGIDVAALYLSIAWSTYSDGNLEAIEIMWQLLQSLDLLNKESVAHAMFESVPFGADKTRYSAFRRSLINHVFFVSDGSRSSRLSLPRNIGRQLLNVGQVHLAIHVMRFWAGIEAERIRLIAVLLSFLLFGGGSMYVLLERVLPFILACGSSFVYLGIDKTSFRLVGLLFYCFISLTLTVTAGLFLVAKNGHPYGRSWNFDTARTGSTNERSATSTGTLCTQCLQSRHKQARTKQRNRYPWKLKQHNRGR